LTGRWCPSDTSVIGQKPGGWARPGPSNDDSIHRQTRPCDEATSLAAAPAGAALSPGSTPDRRLGADDRAGATQTSNRTDHSFWLLMPRRVFGTIRSKGITMTAYGCQVQTSR